MNSATFVLSTGNILSDGHSGSGAPNQDVLDKIKALTYLEPKAKPRARPGIVQQGSAGFDSNILSYHKELAL